MHILLIQIQLQQKLLLNQNKRSIVMDFLELTNGYDIAVKTLTMHGYIVGGSGSGKSVTIQKLME
ncbi:MAG: ABC-type dipeptide/oligopeptide/nickel transport system ATPase component [Dasania sp.]|jgi:ABC-type dipeptide/oligopeptide/nickel transport system ATPase component